jgi:signal transduction histidine kinase
VQYNATRRAVLAGADGVVFVADSQRDQLQANRQSLDNLKENLEANGIDPASIPMVLQYNKRDLAELVSVDELEQRLNPGELASFPTVAITGDGVMDAFTTITEMTLVSLADRLGIDSSGQAIDRLREQARAALAPFLADSPTAASADDRMVTVPESAPDETGPLPQEVLVREAVRANLAMTDLSTRLEALGQRLERRARITRAIIDFGRTVTRERDPAEVLRLLLRTAVSHLGVQAATVLIVPSASGLREAVVHGVDSDPLLAAPAGPVSIAGELAEAGEPVLIANDLEGMTAGAADLAIERAGFGSAIAVPLVARDRLVGMLTVYRSGERASLDEEDLELAAILGSTAAMGYANALAFRRLEERKTDLEGTVAQRNDELRATLQEVEQLNRELRDLDQIKSELITRVARSLEKPVASMTTAAAALESLRDAPVEKTSRLLEVITNEADRLAKIVESVSQASIMVGGSETSEMTHCSLPELLRAAVAPLRDLARRLEVEIKILSPGDLETVTCDGPGLTAALRAVIKNAIEHSPSGAAVRLEIHRQRRRDQPWIEFAVCDGGHGIPETDRERIFEPFWRSAAGKRSGVEGIGLGLVIARQIVERHDGRVTVTGVDGGGTRVALLLPQ